MAWVFVRLKLRLLRNSLTGNWLRRLGLGLSVLVVLPATAAFAVLLAFLRGEASQYPLLVLGAIGLTLAWVMFPVIAFGSDETLDPTRLVLLPLRPVQLMAGLFAVAFVGIPPAATLLMVAGAAAGAAPAGVGAIAVAGGALVLCLQCVVASRAAVTLLARWLQSRRGRDVTMLLAALLIGGAQGLRFVGPITTDQLHRAALTLQWLPPAWAGRAMTAGAQGRIGLAVLCLAGATTLVGGLGLVWWRSLARVLTVAEAATPPARRRRGEAPSLFPRWASFLPHTPLGAVAARELRYMSREPRRRVMATMNLLGGTTLIVPLALAGASDPRLVLVVGLFGWMVGITALNGFGGDGRAYGVHITAGVDGRADLTGRNLAIAALVVPPAVVGGVPLAALTGGWAYLPAVPVVVGVFLALQLAVGNVTSVLVPLPVAERRGNPVAMGPGQGCLTVILIYVAMLVEVVLLVPASLLVGLPLAKAPPTLLMTVPVAVLYAAGVWWGGLAIASRRLLNRRPELLARISPTA